MARPFSPTGTFITIVSSRDSLQPGRRGGKVEMSLSRRPAAANFGLGLSVAYRTTTIYTEWCVRAAGLAGIYGGAPTREEEGGEPTQFPKLLSISRYLRILRDPAATAGSP